MAGAGTNAHRCSISAWRDTARPTKAPTATPIPSNPAATAAMLSKITRWLGRRLPLGPQQEWPEQERMSTDAPSLLGVTLLGLERHQQQRLYQASLPNVVVSMQQQLQCRQNHALAGTTTHRTNCSRSNTSTEHPFSMLPSDRGRVVSSLLCAEVRGCMFTAHVLLSFSQVSQSCFPRGSSQLCTSTSFLQQSWGPCNTSTASEPFWSKAHFTNAQSQKVDSRCLHCQGTAEPP